MWLILHMNKLTIVLILLIVLVGGFVVFTSYFDQSEPEDEVVGEVPGRDVYLSQFANQSLGITFDYPDGPDGYVIDDLTSVVDAESQDVPVVAAYRIMNKAEKQELENSTGGREGAPAMQLTVYQNDESMSASEWIDAFSGRSNIALRRGEVADTVVGEASGVQYQTDGLYAADNFVVVQDGHVYHFVGAYLEPESIIHQDFKALVDSVRFTASTNSNGEVDARIDVRMVCESALAYMSFATGEQADQFVAECVAGEHPDVIERYINDRGLEGTTI